MKRYKWFWITFGSWCLMGAVGSWALIFSPPHPRSRLISEFTATINGLDETNQILVTTAPMELASETLTRDWESQGWKPLTKNFNLALALLNLPRAYDKSFSSLAQLHVFQDQKTMAFRILGSIRNAEDRQTYQWIAQIPQKALHPGKDQKIDFPFKPLRGAVNLISIKADKVDVLAWESNFGPSTERSFSSQCASQGFDMKLWSRDQAESTYILKRGSTKLLAVVGCGPGKNMVSLVKLD